MTADLDFLLKFTLLSYAAVLFFTIGLGLYLSRKMTLNVIKLGIIFVIISIFLNLSYKTEPLHNRLAISFVWTSVLAIGFRFGGKITKKRVNSP